MSTAGGGIHHGCSGKAKKYDLSNAKLAQHQRKEKFTILAAAESGVCGEETMKPFTRKVASVWGFISLPYFTGKLASLITREHSGSLFTAC